MVVRCPRCGSKRVSKNQRSNKFKWECDMCKREFNSSSSALDVNAELEKVEQLRRERKEREKLEQERLLAQKRERIEKENAERKRLEKQRQERIERERKEKLERERRREEKVRMVRMYKCPRCGNPLYKKDNVSGIGQFYHCEHCGYIKSSWDTNNLSTANFSANTLNRCPRCGGTIIRKLGGPRGIFYGCVNFPICDFAYSSSDQNVSQTFTGTINSAPNSYSNESKTTQNLSISQKKQTYQTSRFIGETEAERKYKKLMEKKRIKRNKSYISNKSRDKNERTKDESYNDYIFRINSQQKVSDPTDNKEKKKQTKVTKAKLLRYIDGCNIDNSLKVNMKIEVRRGIITDMETLRRRINREENNYEKVEHQKEIWSEDDKRKYKKLMEKKRKKKNQTYQKRIEEKIGQNKSVQTKKSQEKSKRINGESYTDYIFRINSQQKVSNPKANKENKNNIKSKKLNTQEIKRKNKDRERRKREEKGIKIKETSNGLNIKQNNDTNKWAIILATIAICLIILIVAGGMINHNGEYDGTDELEYQNSAKGVHLTIWNENSDFNLFNDFNHFKKGHFIIVVMKDTANWEAMEGCLVSVNLKNKETGDEYDMDCSITENSYGYIDTDELPLGEYEVYASYYGDEDHYANYYTDIEIVT